MQSFVVVGFVAIVLLYLTAFNFNHYYDFFNVLPPLYNHLNGSFLTKIFVGLGTAKTQLSQLEETVASATVHKSLSDFKLTVFSACLFVKLVQFGLFHLSL